MVVQRNKQILRVAGFTLLELLVVLTIATLLVSLVPPAISAVVPSVALRSATHDLAQTLRQARGRAIHGNRAVDVVLRFDPPTYAVGDESPVGMPNSVRMDVARAGGFRVEPDEAVEELYADGFRLRFFPDGSSTGAVISLLRGDTGYRVDVGWLAGNFRITTVPDDR